MSKVYTYTLSDYGINDTSNFRSVASKMDEYLITHFSGKSVVIRCIDISDHPNCSREDLINKILETGTDINDPNIHSRGRSVDEAELCAFLVDNLVRDGIGYFYCPIEFGEHPPNIIWDFYNYEPFEGTGHRRIDLALIYDTEQLVNVDYSDDRFPGAKRTDGYNFVDKANKTKALLGILNFKD